MDLFQYSLLKNNPLYEGALPNNSDWNSLLEKADKLVSVSILRKQYSNIRSIIAKIGHIDKFIEPQAIFIEQLLKSNSNIANSNYEDEIVGKLKNLNFTSSESLYYWLQQHTSTLKADIQPDTLSSFEFYKSRAAFAHCLAKETVSEYPFILLCVDISGIQDFIYNIHSRRASKSLKGRSFYLGLILDAIQKSILQATKMPICNVIYGNGGKSYLLLPNTEGVNSVSNKLKEIYDKVNGALFNEYQGSLYCCMAWSAFNINEHYNIACNELLRDKTPVEGLNDLWRLVTEKASLQKQKKFRHLLDSRFTDFFSGTLHTEDINSLQTAICAVSGLPTQKIRENIIDGNKSDVNDETNVFVRSEIMIQINLGEQLKDCNYIEISYIKQDNTWIEPLELGVYYKLSSTNESQTECYCINPTTNDEWWSEGCTGYWFYGGNQQAIVKDSKTGETRWKTFEELATPNEDKGFNKLAILRMDVDNLGDVFTKGLGNDNKYRTFATYSALSSTLDHFFSGYLNSIRNHTDYKDYVNIIYSGGDDVFVVGRWKEVIAFANEVQRDFYQLSDGKLTLSAGITVINPKLT